MKHLKTFEGHKYGTSFDEAVHIPMYQKLAIKNGFEEKEVPEDFSYGVDEIEKIYAYWERSIDQYFTIFKTKKGEVLISFSGRHDSGYEDAVEFLNTENKFFNTFKITEQVIYDELKILNEEITYEQLGMKTPDYKKKVKYRILDIISNEKGVSEKSFKMIEELQKRIDEAFQINPEIADTIRRYEQRKCRVEFCAEHIYEWFIKGTNVEKIN